MKNPHIWWVLVASTHHMHKHTHDPCNTWVRWMLEYPWMLMWWIQVPDDPWVQALHPALMKISIFDAWAASNSHDYLGIVLVWCQDGEICVVTLDIVKCVSSRTTNIAWFDWFLGWQKLTQEHILQRKSWMSSKNSTSRIISLVKPAIMPQSMTRRLTS